MPNRELLQNAYDTLSILFPKEYSVPLRNSPEHTEKRWRWLRHGYVEALFLGIFFSQFPKELERDINRYGQLAIPEIQLGVALHDALGKPNVTDNPGIWDLPRKLLTAEDLAAMQRHHSVGYQYTLSLWESDIVPQVVRDIVLYHHERLDGTGPEKLVGAQIPHIVQCATVVDQLISRIEKRSYHDKTYTLPEAFTAVNIHRGQWYNPEILDQVEQMLNKNMHLREPGLLWLGRYEQTSLLCI